MSLLPEPPLKCDHYTRGCELRSPCCRRSFGCHVCHDEAGCGDKLDRRSIQEVLCTHCRAVLPAGALQCRSCSAVFGYSHACGVCHIYSDDKPMWHCPDCGICRAGREDDYVHCPTCDACIRTEMLPTHKCAPYAMHRECVVCRRYLFTSRTEVTQLPCGHLGVHMQCLLSAQQYGESLPACPQCAPPRITPCGLAPPASSSSSSSAAGSCIAASLESMLESLRLTDDAGGALARTGIYGSGSGSGVIPCAHQECARQEWPNNKVYVADSVTAGYYVRAINRLPAAVIPGPEDNAEGSRAVHLVAEALRKIGKSVLSVDRVHIGGSFGRKTTVRGRWDVDLLVLVNDFEPRDSARVETTLDKVATELERRFGQQVKRRPQLQMLQIEDLSGVEMDIPFVRNRAVYADRNKAAAQVRALVAPLLALQDKGVAELACRAGEPDRARERAVSEALTEFVQGQHTVANEAVRLFKAWVKCGLAERRLLASKKLPSIALELIVLAAYQREVGPEEEEAEAEEKQVQGSRPIDSLRESRSLLLRVFVRALDLASRLLEPGLVVTADAGAELGYRRQQGLRFRAFWGGRGPFIIHPIDPTCNVAREPDNSRPPWDWAGLAKQAGILLSVLRYCSLEVLMRESSLGAALYRLRHGIGL